MLQNESIQTSTENAWDIQEKFTKVFMNTWAWFVSALKHQFFSMCPDSWLQNSSGHKFPRNGVFSMPSDQLVKPGSLTRGQVKNSNKKPALACHHGSFAPYKQPIINSITLILAKGQGKIWQYPRGKASISMSSCKWTLFST